ncbi:MAG: hypothetical protein IPL46_10110 [Saprospiraceae bacterium]|nr:hypothetical protein [Saprospiraceae bacterium]
MKRNFNKRVIAILTFGSLFMCCISYKNQLLTGAGNIDQARKNVIIDFANTYKTPRSYIKKREGRSFDVFWIFKEDSEDDLLRFSVSPEIDGHIPLRIKDSLGQVPHSYFPNNFEIEKGKLFVWKDSITPLRKDILNVMNNFGVLDSTDVKRELGLLRDNFEDARVLTIDHKLKSTHYYICKESTEKFKKVITSKAFGYYESPGLNCP